MSVCLCDTSGKEDLHVNDYLVHKGYAQVSSDNYDADNHGYQPQVSTIPIIQSVTFGKNKSGLVKVPVHLNVYWSKFLTKCPFGAMQCSDLSKPLHNSDTDSLHFNHFHCMGICEKLSRHL